MAVPNGGLAFGLVKVISGESLLQEAGPNYFVSPTLRNGFVFYLEYCG